MRPMESDAIGLLILTWIVQGIINSRKTGEIERLNGEIQRLKSQFERISANGKP
jgi:hypothetical protein